MTDFELTSPGVEYYQGHRVDLDGQFMDVAPLCRQHRKRFRHWQATDDYDESLRVAAKLAGKPASSLIRTREGSGGYTFVHRYLWYDFARWCSVEAREWMLRLIDKYSPEFVHVALGEPLPVEAAHIVTAPPVETITVTQAPCKADDLLAQIVPHFTNLVMANRSDHDAILASTRNKEPFMGDVRQLLNRAHMAWRPNGTCALTGLRIYVPGPPWQEIAGMLAFHHILSRRATYDNGWPMYRVQNMHLYQYAVTPEEYWTKRAEWAAFKARYIAEHPREREIADRIRVQAERDFARYEAWEARQRHFEQGS